jgi:hypothetical protein
MDLDRARLRGCGTRGTPDFFPDGFFVAGFTRAALRVTVRFAARLFFPPDFFFDAMRPAR